MSVNFFDFTLVLGLVLLWAIFTIFLVFMPNVYADISITPFNDSVVILTSSTTNPSSLDPSPLYHESCEDQLKFICR